MFAGVAEAQLARASRPWAANVIVPHVRPVPSASGAIETTQVDVGVVILEQVATTTMDISVKNTTGSQQIAELLLPVPDGVAIRSFTFEGSASEPTAELLRSEQARETFQSIVSKLRDPALIEFAGYNLVRTSVFPVEANGTQKVRLTYEHLLTADGDRIDYVLPRSESVTYRVPWNVSVSVRSKRPITTLYSPTHKLETTRSGKGVVGAKIAKDATTEPGAFRLSYLLESGTKKGTFYFLGSATEK